ncbi:hypothetical protein DFH29DRAFT_364623 [Suillus ampliporus]|nr:hypothetical protein DFH29DRAFT_364623 [Suillus ampliporus]
MQKQFGTPRLCMSEWLVVLVYDADRANVFSRRQLSKNPRTYAVVILIYHDWTATYRSTDSSHLDIADYAVGCFFQLIVVYVYIDDSVSYMKDAPNGYCKDMTNLLPRCANTLLAVIGFSTLIHIRTLGGSHFEKSQKHC